MIGSGQDQQPEAEGLAIREPSHGLGLFGLPSGDLCGITDNKGRLLIKEAEERVPGVRSLKKPLNGFVVSRRIAWHGLGNIREPGRLGLQDPFQDPGGLLGLLRPACLWQTGSRQADQRVPVQSVPSPSQGAPGMPSYVPPSQRVSFMIPQLPVRSHVLRSDNRHKGNYSPFFTPAGRSEPLKRIP